MAGALATGRQAVAKVLSSKGLGPVAERDLGAGGSPRAPATSVRSGRREVRARATTAVWSGRLVNIERMHPFGPGERVTVYTTSLSQAKLAF